MSHSLSRRTFITNKSDLRKRRLKIIFFFLLSKKFVKHFFFCCSRETIQNWVLKKMELWVTSSQNSRKNLFEQKIMGERAKKEWNREAYKQRVEIVFVNWKKASLGNSILGQELRRRKTKTKPGFSDKQAKEINLFNLLCFFASDPHWQLNSEKPKLARSWKFSDIKTQQANHTFDPRRIVGKKEKKQHFTEICDRER